MKKVISMVLSIVMLVTMMSVGFTAQAAGKSSIYKYCAVYEKDDEGHYVIVQKPESYFDSLTTVYNYYDENTNTLYIKGKGKIPDEYFGKNVLQWYNSDLEWDEEDEELYSETLSKLNDVKHLVIEEGITGVGIGAFYRSLPNCETYKFPSTLKEVDAYSFSYNSAAKSITLSKGLETVSEEAFSYFSNLETLSLPKTLKVFGTIDECEKLKELNFPKSVTKVFGIRNCPALERINLPDTLQYLGSITSCNSLKELVIPVKVKNSVYVQNCCSLETVIDKQENGLDLSGGTIQGCPNIKEVYFLQKKLKKVVWANCKPDSYDIDGSAEAARFGIDAEYFHCPYYISNCNDTVKMYVYSGNYDFVKYAKWRKVNYQLLDAPKAVTKLKAAKVTANSIKLTWKESKNATFYKVQRYYYGKKKWETLANVKGTSYTVEKISSASTYKFRVKPVNKTKATYEAGKYAYVNATTKPAMTKNVKVKKSAGKLKVSYSKVKNATDYQIYIKTGENGEYKKAGTTTKTTFTTAKLKKGKTYYVKVRARKKVSKGKYTYGAYSKEVKVKI